MNTTSYTPLWCKSNYSFLEGASHPEEFVHTAAALGHHLALPGLCQVANQLTGVHVVNDRTQWHQDIEVVAGAPGLVAP